MSSQRTNKPGWIEAFITTQRIPRGSRLSAWLHGESMMGCRNEKPSAQGLRQISRPIPTARHHIENYSPAPRPVPLASPVNFSRPLADEQFLGSNDEGNAYIHPAFASPATVDSKIRDATKAHDHQTSTKHNIKKPTPVFFHSKDPRIRRKSIGTLVSGMLLIVVLTTCKSLFPFTLQSPKPNQSPSVDLAIATSNVVSTTTFHAVFIFFILLLTMIFAHFLIRLCMLSFCPNRRLSQKKTAHTHHHRNHHRQCHHQHHHHHHHHRRRHRHPHGLQSHPPNSPAPIFLLQDEEASLEGRESIDTDKNIPAPPPAYGWWRGSVRIDPQDLRCQNIEHSDLQQQTRSLVFAGSGHSPPSYTSGPLETSLHVESARPAPLFSRERLRGGGLRDV